MSNKKIQIASDHAGFELKQELIAYLKEHAYDVEDFGPNSNESVDYPDYAHKLCQNFSGKGILICGSGIGMSITANRYKNIRAALCFEEEIAKLSRQHNDSNVLVLGARFLSADKPRSILKTWLETEFEAGRHLKRIDKIEIT